MSRTPTRATRAEELVARLTTIADAEELNEWGIRRLEREARALMNFEPVAAHTVLGGIASLEGDVAKVDEYHRIALQLSGNSVEALRNGAASLSRVGKIGEAFEAMLQAHERVPDDHHLLHAAISMAVQSAHFRQGRALYQQWNKLLPDRPTDGRRGGHPQGRQGVDNGMFTEEGAQKVVWLAHEVRRTARVRTAGGSVRLALDGEPDTRAWIRLGRSLRESREDATIFLVASALTLYIAAIGIHQFEHEAQPEHFGTLGQGGRFAR